MLSLSIAVIKPVAEILISAALLPFSTPFLFASKIAILIAFFSASDNTPFLFKSCTCTINLSFAKLLSVLLPVTVLLSLSAEDTSYAVTPWPPVTFTTAWTCCPSVKLAVKSPADKVVVPVVSVTVLLATFVVPW